MINDVTTTTIKIENSLYDEFRMLNIKKKFHLKDLVLNAMYLYVNDPNFRERLYNTKIPVLSPQAQIVSLTLTGSTPI